MRCSDHMTDDQRLPYLYWHPRAAEAIRKGEKQRKCAECGRWFFSWEMRRIIRAMCQART